MHGTSGNPEPISTWGGLVTLAGPDSLPEGASPRCHDNDFLVGSTGTRDGLTSVYTYSGGSIGPVPGGTAIDTANGGTPWTNPTYVLADDANYASSAMVVSVLDVIVTDGGSYLNSTAPVVVFAGTGSGAVATAVMGFISGHWQVVSVNVTVGGSYTSPVTVSFVGGSVTFPASGTASLSASHTDFIDITQFGLSLPPTSTPTGFVLTVNGYALGSCGVTVQLLKAGSPTGESQTQLLNIGSPTVLTFGTPNDLFGGTWLFSDLNSTSFGIRVSCAAFSPTSAFIGFVSLVTYFAPSQVNFEFITSFTDQNGVIKNISLDASGNLWVENLSSAPGVLTLAREGIASNSHALGVQGEGVEYLAFNDGVQGSDIPLQYTSDWIDRITQVGPGMSPVFTPQVATADVFNISTITQPPQKSDPTDPGHFQALLWSSGPGSATAGNVITVYYANKSAGQPQDSDLVNAFNSGNAVYVYISTAPFGNGTYQVTSVGNAIPPHGAGERWYFTYQVTTSNYQFFGGPDDASGLYQRTLSTMTMTDAVPGLSVGNQVLISGSSVPAYNTTWTITQAIDSGSMVITATAVSGGVATYSYALSTGVAPVAGQKVTITGTTNANGLLNVVNGIIATASGGSTGNFTINLSAPDATSAAESGQATTAGKVFAFDPGFTTLGTMTSPIYASATGGTLTFGGSGQFIGTGTRQGVVFFITRNGYYTAPSPPVTFTGPSNTVSISASGIPIGPPNVIARGIAFTEAGQNGVPGANFFTIPTPVQYIVNNVSYTATSLIIQDNTTTSATFTFTDSVLLNARAIDIYGFNLFNQIELGNPGWIVSYDSRNFYGMCQNKIQNFNNLSFDGGYLLGLPIPLGWTVPDVFGTLLVSPVFGNSYYIANHSGTTQPIAGLISQTAFQDAYQQPIINANTAYSVRITCRTPASTASGQLTVDLEDANTGQIYGARTILLSQMSSFMRTFTATLLAKATFMTVPANLQLRIYAQELPNGGDVEIDRIEIFPTAIPVLGTTAFGSYSGLPEQVDGVTGQVKFTSENQQPVSGGLVMYDTFYGLKGQGPNASMYSLQASANLEPAQWEEPEVAQRAGACGPLAFDFGEQWLVCACRNGVYFYEGGQPGKIMQEIYQVWDALNWQAETSIWVRNDVTSRRLLIGVPMSTPNFWLPDASPSVNPASPNVILMLNYQGLDNGREIEASPGMHTTMFGTLNAIDMRRKWSIWQIPSPYGAVVNSNISQPGIGFGDGGFGDNGFGGASINGDIKGFYICNGIASSKIYVLDPNATTDDSVPIDTRYTTAGIGNPTKVKEDPMLGAYNKRTGYMSLTANGSSKLNVTFLPNQLIGPADGMVEGYNTWAVPGGFNLKPVCLWDLKASVNFFASRTFVELRGADFNVSQMTLAARKDPWNAPWGPK